MWIFTVLALINGAIFASEPYSFSSLQSCMAIHRVMEHQLYALNRALRPEDGFRITACEQLME